MTIFNRAVVSLPGVSGLLDICMTGRFLFMRRQKTGGVLGMWETFSGARNRTGAAHA
ncbi:hypothetical protein EV128_10828 [Rhizobium azibense]|nr:hypothetical protein EV128_10828 [Rhizobium azibense]